MPAAQRITFTERQTAILEPFDFDPTPAHDHELVFETLVSAISSGTELASYTNDQDIGHWEGEPYPVRPGYASIGRVIAIGDGVDDWAVGDVAFVQRGHASHHRADARHDLLVKAPTSVPPEDAVYVRFCAVSMTTLVTTVARPGDGVAVFGLGIVGATAAQVFQASGYEVVAFDPVAARRDVVKACGVRHTAAPDADIGSAWAAQVGDTPCRLVLDTSGSATAVQSAVELADIGAEIALIGVHWKSDPTRPMAALLQPVFTKYLTIRSGWEHRLPTRHTAFMPGNKTSVMRHAMRLLERGEIDVKPLRSHLLSPKDAQSAYQGLLNRRDDYFSVVFDWSR
ncbi:zinc-binding alcohol dehydrogenase [Candidatus Poribacteria bacterium]|jgi:2-desacetyl-2-hydroxyethyl bacteriochlorophyllide A dehydrogenase|nr:zinc-binding alcohol dehydrogenase [Candidatus Poribacteria bacterium]MBT5712635.1 zinc-binding alcohol dehydrogenase [Candidatus Poribacteria bacterium]MBT7808037.1 zinc-binding alcohol dehydrogenase [Candidatus Poribacteria bacterium]